MGGSQPRCPWEAGTPEVTPARRAGARETGNRAGGRPGQAPRGRAAKGGTPTRVAPWEAGAPK
eukprot:8285609-Lingulodinium_polyedra.AAC.1